MYDWKITAKKFIQAAGPGMAISAIAAAVAALNEGLGVLQSLDGEITVTRIALVVAGAIGAAILAAITGALKALQNYVKNRKPGVLPPFDNAVMVLFVAGACLCFSSCATTHQSVKTMEGDTFSQTAFSTLGKQNSEQDISAKFGNSEILVGGSTEQDSTAMVPMIQALVGALVQQQQAGGVDAPERGRLEALEAQIAALRRIIETLRPVDKKW